VLEWSHLLRLAPHESLGLREEVGEQDHVVLAHLVLRLNGSEEVSRNDLGALVDQLIERVLAVRAFFKGRDDIMLAVSPGWGNSHCRHVPGSPHRMGPVE
jgi:hypothetical protein